MHASVQRKKKCLLLRICTILSLVLFLPILGFSQSSVSLTWVPSVSSGVTGYNVYRGTKSGGPYSRLSASIVPGTTYSDTNVASGSTYYYTVTAVDVSSNESGYSPEAAAIIPASAGGTTALPALSSLTCNPSSLQTPSTSQCTATLTVAAGSGGVPVSLSSSSSLVSTPAQVVVPEGASSAQFAVSAVAVSTKTYVTITAGYSGVFQTFRLTLNRSRTTRRR